jgi:hypothetical protein
LSRWLLQIDPAQLPTLEPQDSGEVNLSFVTSTTLEEDLEAGSSTPSWMHTGMYAGRNTSRIFWLITWYPGLESWLFDANLDKQQMVVDPLG